MSVRRCILTTCLFNAVSGLSKAVDTVSHFFQCTYRQIVQCLFVDENVIEASIG
jgi:hypothetical protein